MNLRAREPDEPEVNITSLIDVVLMLLIFFMVSTTFMHTGALKINLPHAKTAAKIKDRHKIEVTVDAKGHFSVNSHALADTRRRTLKRALARAAGQQRSRPLFIRADAKAANQALVTVMDVASEVGLTRIRIVTSRRHSDK